MTMTDGYLNFDEYIRQGVSALRERVDGEDGTIKK